jgi:hypothetical protein
VAAPDKLDLMPHMEMRRFRFIGVPGSADEPIQSHRTNGIRLESQSMSLPECPVQWLRLENLTQPAVSSIKSSSHSSHEASDSRPLSAGLYREHRPQRHWKMPV